MKLFTIGPVEMYPSTQTIRAKGIRHFRTTEYGEMTKSCLQRLQKLLDCKTENGLIYLACSGTGAMEAAIDNCLTTEDKVLVVNSGSFGHRFCELCEWHNINYTSLDLSWNETLTAKHLQTFDNKGFTALLVNLHETSTGQLYNIKILSDFCKRNNMYLIVDAISTFLADDFAMDKYGIDVTIFSSQKGLCLSPGMSFIAFSNRMKKRVLNNPTPKSYYFNFKDYLNNIPRGQTPFTPPVCVMYELQDMLDKIDAVGGKNAWLKNIADKCIYFRNKAKAAGYKVVDYPLSNMLTPIYFENISAYDIFVYLKDHFDIYFNPCGGELADKLCRISHIGNTTKEDFDDLLEKMDIAVKALETK